MEPAEPHRSERLTSSAPRRRRTAPGPDRDALRGLGRFLRGFPAYPVRLLGDAVHEFGDVVRFRIGPYEAHLVSHPDDVQRVLVDNARNYDKRSPGYGKLKLALGEGLLTSEGDEW